MLMNESQAAAILLGAFYRRPMKIMSDGNPHFGQCPKYVNGYGALRAVLKLARGAYALNWPAG